MENKTLSPLYVAKLTVRKLYSLNESTIELAKPVVTHLGPVAAAGFHYLESINKNLSLTLNKNAKSAYTQELQKLDEERDAVVLEIKRETASALRSSNTEKQKAASVLHLFLTPYWDVDKIDVDVETRNLNDLADKYKASTKLIDASKILMVDHLFTSLEGKNLAFKEVFFTRIAENSPRIDSASTVKPVAVAAYIQFCTAIEQLVNFAPNDTVVALFYQIDEIRKYYHAQLTNTVETPEASVVQN